MKQTTRFFGFMLLIGTAMISVSCSAEETKEFDPKRVHKDQYMTFCQSQGHSIELCQCNMINVSKQTKASKVSLEKHIEKQKFTNALILKPLFDSGKFKNETELRKACDILEKQKKGEASKEEIEQLGLEKDSHLMTYLQLNYCANPLVSGTQYQDELDRGEYNYINTEYLKDRDCKKKHPAKSSTSSTPDNTESSTVKALTGPGKFKDEAEMIEACEFIEKYKKGDVSKEEYAEFEFKTGGSLLMKLQVAYCDKK
ncbi:MAG: hypothetical protein ACRBDL_08500 [Alphaproteobacteria bacterium]